MNRLALAFIATIIAMVLCVCCGSAAWAVEPTNKSRFGGIAIKGYDPVAYFQQGKAVAGQKDITFEWQGATWRFSSTDHRSQFIAKPESYAPQYGGYCAYAVSQGKTAAIDPDAWTIHDNKLYLNYSQKISDKWRQDIPGYVEAGDQEWPKLLSN